MRRDIQVRHHGALVTVIVDDPMDSGEWVERAMMIDGDALALLEAVAVPGAGVREYTRLMDKVGKEVVRQRKNGPTE